MSAGPSSTSCVGARDARAACGRSARSGTSRSTAPLSSRADPGRTSGAPGPAPRTLRCCWELEQAARAAGFAVVAGVDEVGRGALFGPVFAGAVILGDGIDTDGIDDSKRLAAARREALAERIRKCSRAHAIGSAEAAEIDRLGIAPATHLAMRRALAALAVCPDLALVDGLAVPDLPVGHWPIVKGDARSFSIAAASIIAKVARDELIRRLDGDYPGYGLARNKGYGSLEHRQALLSLGLSPLHRRAFCHRQMELFPAPATDQPGTLTRGRVALD